MFATKTAPLAVVFAAVLLSSTAHAQAANAPVDGIYPDSNARLPQVKRDDLDESGRRIYDALTAPGARYEKGFRGPAAMWIYSPEFAEKAAALGLVARGSKILGPKLTELAIMAVGVELGDMTEFEGHLPNALAAGLPQATADIVRARGSVEGIDPTEALVIEFTRQVVGKHHLDRAVFDKALERFGPRGLADLQGVIGHYMLCGITNATYDIRPRKK